MLLFLLPFNSNVRIRNARLIIKFDCNLTYSALHFFSLISFLGVCFIFPREFDEKSIYFCVKVFFLFVRLSENCIKYITDEYIWENKNNGK